MNDDSSDFEGRGGPHAVDTHTAPAAAAAIDPLLLGQIKELYRRRQDFLNAEGSLGRQVKAIARRLKKGAAIAEVLPGKSLPPLSTDFDADADPCRDATQSGAVCIGVDSVSEEGCDEDPGVFANHETCVDVASYPPFAPLMEAKAMLHKNRPAEERALTKLVKQLPAYEAFCAPLKGFGAIGLGQIVGEAGDLSRYANPAKLWKRFGVGLVNGSRQRKTTDKAAAIEMGYSPRRRSVLFVITDSLLRQQNAYREIYLARKVYETERAASRGLTVVPAATAIRNPSKHMSAKHVHLRAQRYAGKRLLRDLWRAWKIPA